MTSNEKRLLTFFAVAAFALVNLLGFNTLVKKRDKLQGSVSVAAKKLDDAKFYSEKSDLITDEIDWLNERDLKEKHEQDVQNDLKQFAFQEAQRAGLQVGSQKLLEAVTVEGNRFHRSRVEFKVSGREESFFRWCDRLQNPDQLRAITYLRLVPAREDDTKVEATVIVEQWFIPVSSATASTP